MVFSRERCCITPQGAEVCVWGAFLVFNNMKHPPASCRAVWSKFFDCIPPNIFIDLYTTYTNYWANMYVLKQKLKYKLKKDGVKIK